MSPTRASEDMTIDHVEFYVESIENNIEWLVNGYGCSVRSTSAAGPGDVRSVVVGQGDIDLVLTEPVEPDHPVAAYVRRHGDGIANIGLRVPDAAEAFAWAVRRGARPVAPPLERNGVVTASIIGFGDVAHTFVQRPAGSVPFDEPVHAGTGLLKVDHFAVVVEPGQIDDTVEFYRQVLDFELTLAERIATGDQAMFIKVVQSRSRAVTLTLIESDASTEPSHVDAFLKDHGGAGVQHMALSCADIRSSVRQIMDNGIELLSSPDAYYALLAERMQPARHSVASLRELNILFDEDHDGQLYQIFAKSVHPRNTIFLELIERAGATTFGSSNIKSLYEAVEGQRYRDTN